MRSLFLLMTLVPLLAAAPARAVKQWAIHELSFTASGDYANPYLEQDPPLLQVTFEQAGARLVLEGFWDGGKTWKVRFAPPRPGEWRWRSQSKDAGLDGREGVLRAAAPSSSEIAANANYRGHIHPHGRYFVYADGTPFFWLGDTLWAMGSARCGLGARRDGPFYIWLADRKAKGFTVAFAEFAELTEGNEGGLPFPRGAGPTPALADLNPAYFQSFDARVEAVWEAGMVLAAHPMWVGKHHGLRFADVRRFTRYLLARYGAYNLVWSLSGEYQYSYGQPGERWARRDWSALGAAVATFNPYRHPVSLHPSGQLWSERSRWPREAYGQSSGAEFHAEPWLDHNWTQTGHAVEKLWLVVSRTREDYARVPAKPTIHSEGFYENHWDTGARPEHVRWQAWAAFLNGAAGHGYGAHGLWGFYDPAVVKPDSRDHLKKTPWDRSTWRQALAYPGSGQLRHFASYMGSIEWWTLEPRYDRVLVEGAPPEIKNLTDPHMAASAAGLHVVYVPVGNAGRKLEILLPATGRWTAQRINPRNGAVEPLPGHVEGWRWRIPVPDAQDWVFELRPAG